MIDEFGLLALLATQAKGSSKLKGGALLRNRVPDRLALTAQVLRQFGGDVETDEDGFTVRGPTKLVGAEVQCAGDHRLVMLATIAAAIADGPSVLHGAEAVSASYPAFFSDLDRLQE